MFKGWTLTALGKLILNVSMYSFKRKQEIMSEGQSANNFFIVYEGEVELYKRIHVKHPKDVDLK